MADLFIELEKRTPQLLTLRLTHIYDSWYFAQQASVTLLDVYDHADPVQLFVGLTWKRWLKDDCVVDSLPVFPNNKNGPQIISHTTDIVFVCEQIYGRGWSRNFPQPSNAECNRLSCLAVWAISQTKKRSLSS